MIKKWKIYVIKLCLFACCISAEEWQNDLQVEDGFRIDNLQHSGHMNSPSIVRLKQEIRHAVLFQMNIKDRLTWNNCLFLQGFVGYGYCFHSIERVHGITPVQIQPVTANEIPRPFDDQADPFDFSGEDIQAREENFAGVTRVNSSRFVRRLYSHDHKQGYAWTFDVAVGATFPILEFQILEPRIGYTFQSLHIPKATTTYLQGIYLGLASPIAYRCFQITPDLSFIFAGFRNETIDYFCRFHSHIHHLHAKHGRVLGLRWSLQLEYLISCSLRAGLIWRYSNLYTGSGKRIRIDPGVSWKPRTEWESNQLMLTLDYSF